METIKNMDGQHKRGNKGTEFIIPKKFVISNQKHCIDRSTTYFVYKIHKYYIKQSDMGTILGQWN